MVPSVLYEDNHLLIVNKPAGVLVQSDVTGDISLLDHCKTYIKQKYHKPGAVFLGSIHRLDRPVSGVVSFAKTSKALERMNQLFKSRDIKKIYWAVTIQPPQLPSATLVHWLKKNEKTNKTTYYTLETEGSKRSELSYRLINKVKSGWLLEVLPITGRSHQIRVQLAATGCVIYGDVKYGAPEGDDKRSIGLHAQSLEFKHPVTKQDIVVSAPVPSLGCWMDFVK